MRLGSGIHPERWSLRAWLLALALLLLALALTHRPTGGEAAALAAADPGSGSGEPGAAATGEIAPGEEDLLPLGEGARYVAEVVDSTFVVSPAQFLGLDLPRDPAGARAIHLAGTVSVRGRDRDIILQLFRTSDYNTWLKQDGGRRAEPLWKSRKARTHNLDLVLPRGGPFVLLLDNGYSIRTPKYVSCQLQIQYGRLKDAGALPAAASAAPAPARSDSAPGGENPVTPRSNTEDVPPPPPPPPPGGY